MVVFGFCWHAHCSGRTWRDFRLDTNFRGKKLAQSSDGRKHQGNAQGNDWFVHR
jgi:hypothetical protein